MTLNIEDAHGLIYILCGGGVPEIPTEYVRIPEMRDQLYDFVYANLAAFDVATLLDVELIAEELFDLMLSGGALDYQNKPLVGEYTKLDKEFYSSFRGSALSNDEIYQASKEIGSRYFEDAFEAIRSGVATAKEIEPSVENDASEQLDLANAYNHEALSSAEAKEAFSKLSSDAQLEVSKSDLSNEQKAAAHGYLEAARALANVPEPPTDLIWQILNRGSAIAGIASFFLALITFLTVG